MRLLLQPKRSPLLGACWHISLPGPNKNEMYTQDSTRMLVMNMNMELAGFQKRLAGMQKGTLVMTAMEELLDSSWVRTLEFAAPCLPPGKPLMKLGGAGREGGMVRLMVQCVRTGGRWYESTQPVRLPDKGRRRTRRGSLG